MQIKRNKILFFVIFFSVLFLALFLRFYKLNVSPPSPYWEEVALGYDAYSITQTAKDHHGNFLPILAFESFGDFKPSLYFYVLVPFIKLFGLQVLALRLPTILSSLAIIFGTAVLAKTLFKYFYFKNNQKAERIIFLVAFFLATISPWLLTFSRSAWESTLATALIVWGVNFWLFFINENKTKWAILAVFLLSISTYAYHAARISAPLLGVALLITYFVTKKKRINFLALLVSAFFALLIFFPIGRSLFQKSGQQRIAETSIFYDLSVIEESNQAIAAHGGTFLSKMLYHRYVFFAKEAAIHFFDHFGFKYLFVSGDSNPRHSVQTFGEFYYLDLVFLVLAVVFLIRKRNKISLLLLFYLFAAILPAAFTKATPHALRTLAALPVSIVFISFGIWQFLEIFKKEKLRFLILSLLAAAYCVFAASFFYELIYIYPEKYKSEWQFGYEEMNHKLASIADNYEHIYITREQGRPAMYYFFYNQIEPSLVQAFNDQAKKDQGEFLNFAQIEFIDKSDQVATTKNSLVISSMSFYENFFKDKNFTIIDETENGVWVFYEAK